MDAAHEEMMAELRAWRKKMNAHQEKRKATDLEANPEVKKSRAEHQEVPKTHAAVETGRASKKQHRDQHLVEKGRQESKARTQENCGSQKKLVAARRGTTHHAGVAWSKGHIVGKNQTRDNIVRGAT
jgi:hypothetical protein